MSNVEQWEAFFESSVHIDSFETIDCKFELYALCNFFVELETCKIQGTVIGKNPFTHGQRMEKYCGNLNKYIQQ